MNKPFPDSQRPLSGAIIGFGNVAAKAHLPLWLQDERFEITAITEPNGERAAEAHKMAPQIPVFDDVKSMLASVQPDFVDICTPPSYHAEQIIQALASGAHVFCEKPLVTSLEGLRQILAFRESMPTGQVIFTVNNWKQAPIMAKAIQLVETIGSVTSAELTVLRTPGSGGGASDWRKRAAIAGGGILLDHGWHQIYLLNALMQAEPKAVSARMQYTPEGGPDLEETVDLTLRYPNGDGRLHLTWRAAERGNHGRVVGERGVVDLKDDHLIVAFNNEAPGRYSFDDSLSGGSQHLDWMPPVIDCFHQEVHDPHTRSANFKEARQCINVISQAYQSQRLNSRFIAIDSSSQD